MAYKRKTWKEKLYNSKDLPKIIHLDKQQKQEWNSEHTKVVPSPLEVRKIMSSVPKGHLITMNRNRELLTQQHHADLCCPMITGIFSWIAAYAAADEEKEGFSIIPGKRKSTFVVSDYKKYVCTDES
ncbi:MAG: hypothetical protein LC117_06410 [Bacteroidia bacterium]|nr:hypothetical protein [Bacteroidia bacterium]MCZ2277544.1 hypothetical protein [Bacteroidia bacterium]